jgi:multimeric flavodoxin WrbA
VKTKLLGICGSPRKGSGRIGWKKRKWPGNTEFLIDIALREAEKIGDIETEMIRLAYLEINPCTACYMCDMVGPSEKRICPMYDDDFEYVARKMFESDGIIIGSPVWVADIPAQLKAFFDRWESISAYGKRPWLRQPLRNKVAGAIVTGSLPHGGHEFTAITILRAMMFVGMIPVGSFEAPGMISGTPWGGIGVLCPGSGLTEDTPVKKDLVGVTSARFIGRRVASVAKIVKPGAAAEREKWLEWYAAHIEAPLEKSHEDVRKPVFAETEKAIEESMKELSKFESKRKE